ncbi:MAG: hypothetical protein JXQ71_16895, partial [Verrucomicrobia bacterium]|nr:hypothetical protein [Verrucomicrobiota bacterium]
MAVDAALRRGGATWGVAALLLGATGIGLAPILVRWSEVGPSATAFYRVLFSLPWLWAWMGWEGR